VADSVLSDDEFGSFAGVLGHYHVQDNKVDPGPAFDWERVLERARAIRESETPRD
jgi:N-acetyl-anhydromuramyl-L-alanine amidase AmpD